MSQHKHAEPDTTAFVTGEAEDTRTLAQENSTPCDAAVPEDSKSENPVQSEDSVANATGAQLQTEVEQLRQQVDEHRNLFLQARADVENVRKRAERDLQNAHKYALDKFMAELLPVKDSLEMGLAAIDESADIGKLREGTELTLKMLAAAVAKFGVTEINPHGEKFNPEWHEAMAMQPSSETEPNTVMQVIQKGYRLNDRLVRPAMVIVSQAVPK